MSDTTVQFVSETELLERREEILALLEVFKTNTADELHEELADINYLLGRGE